MKLVSTACLLATAILCLSLTSASAQGGVSYLDAKYHPSNAQDYVYKRVITYRGPIINPNLGTGYYGNLTANPTPSGLHTCSLTDYYRTGEPAAVANIVTLELSCTNWIFDGQVISYYRNGNIKERAPYASGRLQGWVITYNEDATEQKREIYQSGKMIQADKFPVPADSPLVGTWKYVKYSRQYYPNIPPSVEITSTITYYRNSIEEQTTKTSLSSGTNYKNWRYIPRDSLTGIEELYLGDDLVSRGTIRWITRNQFEFTATFSQDPSIVGQTFLWIRQ